MPHEFPPAIDDSAAPPTLNEDPSSDSAPEPDGRIFNAMSRWLLWPVALTVVVIIGFAFVISFQSQVDLAISARIRPEVAFGWPILVDGTIIVSTLAAFILQPRGRRVSWYPWATLILFGALSIWANGIHATDTKPTMWEMFIVGAVPAVGLLLSTHLLVVMLAHNPNVAPAAKKDKQPRPRLALALAPDPFADMLSEPPMHTLDRTTVPVTQWATGQAAADQAASDPNAYSYGPAAQHAAAAWTPKNPTPAPRPVASPGPEPVSTPAAVKPEAPVKKTAPRAVPKKLTRPEAETRYAELAASGKKPTAADISQWMGVSEARANTILTQIRQDADEQGRKPA